MNLQLCLHADTDLANRLVWETSTGYAFTDPPVNPCI